MYMYTFIAVHATETDVHMHNEIFTEEQGNPLAFLPERASKRKMFDGAGQRNGAENRRATLSLYLSLSRSIEAGCASVGLGLQSADNVEPR